jgi:predicted acyl esterase
MTRPSRYQRSAASAALLWPSSWTDGSGPGEFLDFASAESGDGGLEPWCHPSPDDAELDALLQFGERAAVDGRARFANFATLVTE